MVLFLLFAIPLTSVAYIKLVYSDHFSMPTLWKSFFRGSASFLIAVLPIYILLQLYSRSYTGGSIFLRAFILDYMVYVAVAILFFFLWQRRKCEYEYGRRLFVHILAFVSGFFALSGFFQGFAFYSFYTAYRLFGFPLFTILLLFSLSVGLYLFQIGSDWRKYLSFAIPVLSCLLFAVLPTLFVVSRDLIGMLYGGLIVILGSFAFYLLQIRRRLPGI